MFRLYAAPEILYTQIIQTLEATRPVGLVVVGLSSQQGKFEKKNVMDFQADSALIGYQERYWEMKVAGGILTTSSIECRLEYYIMGLDKPNLEFSNLEFLPEQQPI